MAISSNDSISMAVFCDFENVALGVRDAQYEQFDIRPVLERLLVKGSIVVKKAYCDWDRYKGFKNAMHEANFELIEIPHVRQSGKNSADIRLVVDALDLCYTKSHVDTFVIISGDSDFSPLVSKLRENAKQVIGVGVKQSTSDLLIANCDEFIFYDDLVREQARRSGARQAARDNGQNRRGAEEAKPRREDVETRRTQALEIAMTTYDALSSERGDGSKLWASVLKDAIKRRRPDFNESYYGFRAFGNLLDEAQTRGLLRVGRDERSGTYVYRDHSTGDVPVSQTPAPAAAPAASTKSATSQAAASAASPAPGSARRPSRRGTNVERTSLNGHPTGHETEAPGAVSALSDQATPIHDTTADATADTQPAAARAQRTGTSANKRAGSRNKAAAPAASAPKASEVASAPIQGNAADNTPAPATPAKPADASNASVSAPSASRTASRHTPPKASTETATETTPAKRPTRRRKASEHSEATASAAAAPQAAADAPTPAPKRSRSSAGRRGGQRAGETANSTGETPKTSS